MVLKNYNIADILLTVLIDFFFFNDTATTEIYTLSLHDALPISIYRGWYVCTGVYVSSVGTSHVSCLNYSFCCYSVYCKYAHKMDGSLDYGIPVRLHKFSVVVSYFEKLNFIQVISYLMCMVDCSVRIVL